MANLIFSVAAIGLTIILTLGFRQARRRRCAIEDADLLNKENFNSSQEEEEEIAGVVQEQVCGGDVQYSNITLSADTFP